MGYANLGYIPQIPERRTIHLQSLTLPSLGLFGVTFESDSWTVSQRGESNEMNADLENYSRVSSEKADISTKSLWRHESIARRDAGAQPDL